MKLKWITAVVGSIVITANAGLTFNWVPDPDTPQYVIDGFNLAAGNWSTVLAADITLDVAIGYQSMTPGILGQTASSTVSHDYAATRDALLASATSSDDQSAYSHLSSGSTYTRQINHTTDSPAGPNSATPYSSSLVPVLMTTANAKALGLAAAAALDGTIRFNSNMAFNFDPSLGPVSGKYDFVSAATHELGHLLGFNSIVDQNDGTRTAADLPSMMLDLFRYSALGVNDVTGSTTRKYLSFDGGATGIANLASGTFFGTGYQASHWQEFTFVGLMDPALFTRMQRSIKPTDLRGFDVLGYTIVPEPATAALLALGLVFLFRARRFFP